MEIFKAKSGMLGEKRMKLLIDLLRMTSILSNKKEGMDS
jgi:hypothetical protein